MSVYDGGVIIPYTVVSKKIQNETKQGKVAGQNTLKTYGTEWNGMYKWNGMEWYGINGTDFLTTEHNKATKSSTGCCSFTRGNVSTNGEKGMVRRPISSYDTANISYKPLRNCL